MMTLPESGGTPLVSCQRMRQTNGRRLSADGRRGAVRGIDANLRPLARASRALRHGCENVYQECHR
jgi:hypothetical protein